MLWDRGDDSVDAAELLWAHSARVIDVGAHHVARQLLDGADIQSFHRVDHGHLARL